MKLFKRRQSYGCDVNMTPMIDMVFQLIIFFMCVTHMSRVEVKEIKVPEAQKGEEAEKKDSGRFVINVTKEGKIAAAGQVWTLESLRTVLANHVRGRKPDEVSVLVRADRELPWEVAAGILSACAQNGIGRIRVAVTDATAEPK